MGILCPTQKRSKIGDRLATSPGGTSLPGENYTTCWLCNGNYKINRCRNGGLDGWLLIFLRSRWWETMKKKLMIGCRVPIDWKENQSPVASFLHSQHTTYQAVFLFIFLSLLFLLLCPLNLSSSLFEVLKNYILFSVVELGVSGSPVFFVLASAPNSAFFIWISAQPFLLVGY